jgi:hypothetical protein
MDAAYIESSEQISDAISFFLVAPEFLGGRTLRSLREGMSGIQKRIVFQQYGGEPFMALVAIISSSILFCGMLLVHRFLPEIRPLAIFLMLAAGFNGVIALTVIILELTRKLVYRRRLFVMGATVFLATRAILCALYLTHSLG